MSGAGRLRAGAPSRLSRAQAAGGRGGMYITDLREEDIELSVKVM
jgi:hypothetical protein